jgi:serine phosphatase RsbU (regulator of sigma subunit)
LGNKHVTEHRILLVEDNDIDAAIVVAYLRDDARFAVKRASTLSAACDALANGQVIDAVLLDLRLPDSSGLETFTTLHRQFPDMPVVVLTVTDDDEPAMAAVHQGAQDYLPKSDATTRTLTRSLLYAIERQRGRLAERQNLLIRGDLDVAREIQQHLLPKTAPQIDGFDIAGRCQQAEAVGGDFFDFIPLADGRWDLLIADVSNHGVAPALVMVGARHLVRTCAQTSEHVGEILTITNRSVFKDGWEACFVTMFLCRLEPRTRTAMYSSAGHPAYVMDAAGNVRALDYSGLPLGINGECSYSVDGSVTLQPGEMLLLMTDGVWEAGATNGRQFGTQRAFDLVHEHRGKPAAEIVDTLVAAAQEFCPAGLPQDDITVGLVKVQ